MATYHEIRYINKINIIVVSYNIGTYNIKKYLEEGKRKREREEENQGGRRKKKYKEYNRNIKKERKICKEKQFFKMN